MSAAAVGMLVGGVVGMALFGAATSWLLRRAFTVSRPTSIVLAICLWSPIAGWLKSFDDGEFLGNWLLYAACGLFAALLLLLADRVPPMAKETSLDEEFDKIFDREISRPRRNRWWRRIAGFFAVTLLGAIGGALIFGAFDSYSEGPVLMFLALLFLIPCILVLRWLLRTEREM